MRESSSVANGLRFYTPALHNGKAETAYEQLEGSGNASCVSIVPPSRDGMYALTPDGEHVLADLDVSQLLTVERDLRGVRSQRN